MNYAAINEVQFYDYHPQMADFYNEVIDGLARQPKRIAPKFFYDKRGSRLFDQICRLPEYYLTRTEISILRRHAAQIADLAGSDCLLVEPGSGSSVKVRILLEAMRPRVYLPMDISREHLLNAAERVSSDYPWLEVHAACVDYTGNVDLPLPERAGRKVAFFPGSTIGNFDPGEAIEFLETVGRMVGANGALLIGVDLKKDAALLNAAYNDAQGVTAQFNLNLLRRINDELDASFDTATFNHLAFYNEHAGRVEMHLVSQCSQRVALGNRQFRFAANETIHTENSYKYTIDEFRALARCAGFTPREVWTDEAELFSVHFLVNDPFVV